MYLRSPLLDAARGIRHGFFTRRGGVSTGIFAELNCGARGSAEPAEIVDENRRRVAAALELEPTRLLSVHQVHGPAVVTVEQAWDMDNRPKADAMVTRMPGFGLGVLTADCAPVLFVDDDARVIGAAHAGWKGAFGGVLQATVAAMEALGARREHIRAAVGPAIAKASYEVDAAFYERFIADDAENARFFDRLTAAGHRYFDLPAYVRARLSTAGVQTVDVLAHDTYAEEADFYSFRRSTHHAEPDYGRQISVIALNT